MSAQYGESAVRWLIRGFKEADETSGAAEVSTKEDIKEDNNRREMENKSAIKDVADVRGSSEIPIKLNLEIDIHISTTIKGKVTIRIL